MSLSVSLNPTHLAALKQAIRRNPQVVKDEAGTFLARAIKEYNMIINRAPWRVGGGGGGAPVFTGHLRDTHITTVESMGATIRPTAPYAEAVHKHRPWLEYASENADRNIKVLEGEMMTNITNKLAR